MKFTRKDVSALLDGLAPSRDLVPHLSSFFAGGLFIWACGAWTEFSFPNRRLCEDLPTGPPWPEDGQPYC
jgi:hypothetical protein